MRRIAIDSSSTVDRVVDALRTEMFAGRLAAGEQLREVELAGTFEVARSTVREALQVLVAEGLATRVRNRGVAVRQLTSDDVDDLYRARCVLEIAGVQNTPRAPRVALEAIGSALASYEAEIAAGDPVRITEMHLRFHTAVVALAGSARLVQMVEGVMMDLRLALASVDRSSDDLPEQLEEHRALWKLIRNARVDDAVKMIEEHLAHSKAYVPVAT
jgi:DNA-binding GntR family transcriptional regulator